MVVVCSVRWIRSYLVLLGEDEDLVISKVLKLAYLREDGTCVPHGLENVPGTGVALEADHGGTFSDAPQCFTEVLGTTYERDSILPLVNVMKLIRSGEDLQKRDSF